MTNARNTTHTRKLRKFTSLLLATVIFTTLLTSFVYAETGSPPTVFAYPEDFKATASEPYSAEYSVDNMLNENTDIFYASKDDETEKWIQLELPDASILPEALLITPRLYENRVVSERINGAVFYGSDEPIIKDGKADLTKANILTTVTGISEHKEYSFEFDLKNHAYKYYLLYFDVKGTNNIISLNLENLRLRVKENPISVKYYNNISEADESTAKLLTTYEGYTVSAKDILPTKEKENAKFIGWYTARTGGEKFEEGTVKSDLSLYAQWEITSAVKPEITEISKDVAVLSGYAEAPELSVTAKTIPEQTLTYQWYSNNEDSNVDGTKIENETNSKYTFPLAQQKGDYYFYCVVTATTENGLTAQKTTTPMTISVNSQESLKIPVLSGAYVYNGENQTAVLENFNAEKMTVKNNSEKLPGTHEITVELKDKALTKWEDGTTDAKTIEWKIEKATLSAPKVTVIHPTDAAQKGKITDVNSDMEYSYWDSNAYRQVEGTELELATGIYKIRYRETIYNEVSSYTIVTINEPNTNELSGTIHSASSSPVTITLKTGSKEAAKTTVTGDRYVLNNIPSDDYNIVIQQDGITITGLLKIHDSITADITIGNISSIVDVAGNTPVVVGNIDVEAKKISEANENAPVSLTMKVTEKNTDTEISNEITKNNQTAAIFFGFDIISSINGGENTEYTLADNLIEIIIPLASDVQSKENYKAYRSHNGSIDILTETANADGEYMVVNDECTQITLHVKKFSTYAIAYNKPSANISYGQGITKFNVHFNTMGGSEINSVKVKCYTPVSQPKEPVRSGYTFKGWYTDEDCTIKYSFSSNVTKSITLYAGWRSNSGYREIIMTINSKVPTVNGKKTEIDVPATIVNNRTLTPARFIAESLGADVEWDSDLRLVTITSDDTTIELTIDSSTAYVNGKAVKLDSPAIILDDRTLTPSRFVAENLGADVVWDDDGRVVTITKE